MSAPLVTTGWLAEHLSDEHVRIADASWYLPQAGRDAKAEYSGAHIPGAVFFDIDELSDETDPRPHMLAPPDKFAARMAALGLGDDKLIVVYDGAGLYSSPRAWWMLRAMGHGAVAVLDGGLPKWRREGRPVTAEVPTPRPAGFTPRPDATILRDFGQMLENVDTHSEQVVDARGAPRFYAREAEPRPGVRGGHIPGSLNVPYSVLTAPDGTLKPVTDLKALFSERCVDLTTPVVTTCGSGVTAALAMLALVAAGARRVALYDGSWSEWGARPEARVEAE